MGGKQPITPLVCSTGSHTHDVAVVCYYKNTSAGSQPMGGKQPITPLVRSTGSHTHDVAVLLLQPVQFEILWLPVLGDL